MVAKLEYHGVCTRRILPVFKQYQKEHRLQVCQDLLNQYEAEGDAFLCHIITSDETWCHRYELESKQQSVEW